MAAETILQHSKRLWIERAITPDLSSNLVYPSGVQHPGGESDECNGKGGKTVLPVEDPLRLDVPCEQMGSCPCIWPPARTPPNWIESKKALLVMLAT